MALLNRLKGNLEVVDEDKNEGLDTEEFDRLKSYNNLGQLLASILPQSESVLGSLMDRDIKPLLWTLTRLLNTRNAEVLESLTQYAESAEGRHYILLLEAVLARKEGLLKNMLALEFKGDGNKAAAAVELFDVLGKSPRIGEIS